MSQTDEQSIRERAYHLWEKEGSPHGRDQEFWERARLLIEAEAAPSGSGSAGLPTSQAEHAADQAMLESFPASDPPAFTADVGARSGTSTERR